MYALVEMMILHITILNIARRRYCSIERDDIEYITILNIARRRYCSIDRDDDIECHNIEYCKEEVL